VLAETLDAATERFLDENKSPSRKSGELDNRGSHYYLALFWAEALATQETDADLKVKFEALAKQLRNDEERIVAELLAVSGQPVDIGGYYNPDFELANKAMRPSATLNAAIDALR
jgi:isocitrate dehydrogenase